MASNASVARPYAQALFELAGETGNQDDWSAALGALSAVTADEAVVGLLDDPRVDREQVVGLMTDLCGDLLPPGGENFIRLLVRNGRVEALGDIARQYELRVADARKSVTAKVASAEALTDDQRARLSSALEKRLGCSVSLQESVDTELVAGAVVRAGDLVIDGSAAGRLRKLAISLAR